MIAMNHRDSSSALSFSVVIPTLNGSSRLVQLLPVLECYGPEEIILVDDCSRAGERYRLRELARLNPLVRLISLPRRGGQIQATLVGVAAAGGEIVITMDDDGAHPPEIIPTIMALFREDREMGLVYAVPRGTPAERGVVRRLGTALNNGLFRAFLGLPRNASVGSFRGIRRDLLRRALSLPVRYPYLSAMLLAQGPRVSLLRYREPVPSSRRSRYRLIRLMRIWWLLVLYWGPLRPLGRLLRSPEPFLPQPLLAVLGGGSSQFGALRRAVEEGFGVLLLDRNENAPGRDLAHRFHRASTFDSVAVSAAVRSARAGALLAVGSDQPVYTAAEVSHALGLPYPLSPDAARAVTHKGLMKRIMANAGIPTVPWTLLGRDSSRWDREGLAKLSRPWVVKPVDSQGQRGIRIVNNREELAEHLPVALSWSRDKQVLVEEFYLSREVTVSGWAGEGIWTITDRLTFDPTLSLGVCLGHRFPAQAVTGCLDGEIRAITDRIVEVFQLQDVPIYFQMLIGREGVRVNEIACRLGGAYEDQSIPLVTGVDVLGKQLDWYRRAFGQPRISDAKLVLRGRPRSRFFAVPLLFARPGRAVSFRGDRAMRDMVGVEDCRFLLPEGTEIRPMANSTQRIGYAVLHGEGCVQVNTLVHALFETLRVFDEGGENLLFDTRGEIVFPSGV